MNTQQLRRIPKIRFRVLVIGRANAGKTSILQRVCDATDSPIIFRRRGRGGKKVTLDPSMDRGEHTVDDELVFSNHEGYIFHDSRGIESGCTEELQILQRFIRHKCRETRLGDRLHAIWYCVPMDNHRPELDLKFFKDICPDRNVPVIAIFTKYDQFRRNVQINVEDFGSPHDNVSDVVDKQFQEHYLRPLGEDVRYVRLEKMHMQRMRCDNLIETTAAALNDNIVRLMLMAVQRGNLKFSVKRALSHVRPHTGGGQIILECLIAFPYVWYFFFSFEVFRDEDFLGRLERFRSLFSSEESLEEELSELLKRQSLSEFRERTREEQRIREQQFELLDFFREQTELRLELTSLEKELLQEFDSLRRRLAFERDEFLRFLTRLRLESEFFRLESEEQFRELLRLSHPFVNQIKALPTIRKLTHSSLHGYHLIFAAILILKHATFLRLSNMSPESALAHAEVDYREANIDSRIEQYLSASPQGHSDELFADFIMAIDITCTHIGVSGEIYHIEN